MMCHTPFLRRVAVPVLTRPGFWLVCAFIGVMSWSIRLDSESAISFFVGLASVFAGVTAMRALDDDQASGTLEQLDVLPVSRRRIVLEIAAGSVLAFSALSGVGFIVALQGLRGKFDYALFCNCLLAVPTFALLGTLVTLRHRMRWYGMVAAALALWLTGFLVIFVLFHLMAPSDPIFAALALIPRAGVLLVVWAGLWRFFHALGGGWSGDDVSRTVRSDLGDGATACGPENLTPDGYNPLFWRELKTGWRALSIMFVLGALYIANGVGTTRHWDGPFNRATNCMGWILMWGCIASSMRTSTDRLSGMWGDLAPTPISVWSVMWCRVRGMMTQASMLAVGWLLLGLALGRVDGRHDAIAGALILACMTMGAILAGFCTGTTGRGLIAGIGGMVLLYLLMGFAMVPGTLAMAFLSASFGGSRSNLAIFAGAALGIGGALTVFYGTLIWGSIRGIRKAAEEQRA